MPRPYVHARLPRSGLGNKLFVWARALVFARRHGLPLVVTGWCTPRWRALLKGEDARIYWNYFTPWNELSVSERSRAKVVAEPALEGGLQSDATVYEFSEMPHWKTCFEGLREHRELIRSELFGHLTAARRREIAAVPKPMICLQIRMGDFRTLKAHEQFSQVGGVRTPLDYFRQWIEDLRAVHGSDVPVTIVSDGTAAELASLLALPKVTHTPGRTGLADLILMADSRLLVCSAGSTFSQWGGFLGDPVLIHHPDHMHYFCRPEADRVHVFEGAESPGAVEAWPPLLRSNVVSLGGIDQPRDSSLKPGTHVLHVPFGYFPDQCGGTEVYVAALCRELTAMGIRNTVAAPGEKDASYTHDGVGVRRFEIDPHPTFESINVRGDEVAARSFATVLNEVKPDTIHFHAHSPAVSIHLLNEARRRGLKTVFTYHTPTASCRRGTLMRWGTEPCEGEMRDTLCAACHLHSINVPRPLAAAAAVLSPVTQVCRALVPAQARWQFPLRSRPLTTQRHRQVRQWFVGMDRIIALCSWTEQLLQLNGVPRFKVRKVRHGLTQVAAVSEGRERSSAGAVPRLIFLGRLDPNKGVHLILDALALCPDLKLEIDLYTVIDAVPGPYVRGIMERLNHEKRARVCAPVKASEVIDTLAGYDALLVPSQWMETGPLVVLEAFAAGVPVVGSHLGGIAEWVTHERDGLLVKGSSANGWAQALRRLVSEPELLPKLRAGILPPRSMGEVAEEVRAVYEEVLRAA